jgi:hypothetical protein
MIRRVDGVLAGGLGIASAKALKKRRWFIGALLAQLAVIALGFASGILRER